MEIKSDKCCDCLFHYGKEDITKLNAYPTVLFIYSGHLIFECNGIDILAKKGDHLFLQKGASIDVTREICVNDIFVGVSISFSKPFLADAYNKHEKRKDVSRLKLIADEVVKLPYTPYLQSLYVSMIPYIEWKTQPSNDIIKLKQEEGICSLLLTDNNLYSVLFEE